MQINQICIDKQGIAAILFNMLLPMDAISLDRTDRVGGFSVLSNLVLVLVVVVIISHGAGAP